MNTPKSPVYIAAMRELLDAGAVGSWRWLSRWRRLDKRAQELFIQAVLASDSKSDEQESCEGAV